MLAVGTRVKVSGSVWGVDKGTVMYGERKPEGHIIYAIEFDNYQMGHSCAGRCGLKSGRWVRGYNLEAIDIPMSVVFTLEEINEYS